MQWTSALVNLRNVLSELYPSEDEARQILATALVSTRTMRFSGSTTAMWTSILEYVANNEQVPDLIQAAVADYPRNSALKEAERRWLAEQQPGMPSPTTRAQAPTGAITLRQPKAAVAAQLQDLIERGEGLLLDLRTSPPSSRQELDSWSRIWHDWRRYSEQTLVESFSSQEPLQWLRALAPRHLDFQQSWEVRAGNLPHDFEGELAFLSNLLARLDNY